MRRGSTPSVDFEIDQVDLKNIKKAEITFRQAHSKIIKSGADILITGAHSLQCKLSQEDTLALRTGACRVQAKLLTDSGAVLATEITEINIRDILNEGVIA